MEDCGLQIVNEGRHETIQWHSSESERASEEGSNQVQKQKPARADVGQGAVRDQPIRRFMRWAATFMAISISCA